MARLRRLYEKVLEWIVIGLMTVLAVEVTVGVVFRTIGHSLVWYDEVASIALAWLTYYAGALAALRGAHIGFPGLVNAMPAGLRVAATLFASAVTILFFVLLAVTGIQVVQILGGTTLVSLPEVSQQVTQSAIPVASALFVLAELIRLPDLVREARRGPIIEHELKEALEAVDVAPIVAARGEPRP